MHRLFVAIRPPAEMRSRLLAAMGGIPGARWQDDAQLHLTLRFIGEVDRHMAEDVAAALGSVHHPAFAIALEGDGMFDKRGRIEALWAGVAPHAPLKSLHEKIDRALHRIGIAPEGRAYLPHITVARFSRGAGVGEARFHLPPGGERAHISQFCLYESMLGRDGAAYEIVARYPLG